MNKKINKVCCDMFASESAQATTEYTVLIVVLLYAYFSLRLLGLLMAVKMGLASKNIVGMAKL